MVSQYLYQLGDYYYKKGELNKANESFRISGEIGYDNEWVQSNLGILLMDKGMSDGAIESCKESSWNKSRFC